MSIFRFKRVNLMHKFLNEYTPKSLKTADFRLKDAVVIIDEAHNLIETINEIHSLTLHEKDCITTHRKLSVYLRKVNKV